MTLIERVKRWFMNLIGVARHIAPDIPIDEDYYADYVEVWKQIYKGYYSEWHDVIYNLQGVEKKRKRASLQTLKFLAAEFSSLIFSEKVTLEISDKNVDEYVKQVLKDNDFYTNQSNLYELAFALGGACNYLYRDTSQDAEKTMIDYVNADKFIPTAWDNSRVTSGMFITESYKDKYVYYLVSNHDKTGNQITVTNTLFRQKRSDMGISAKGVEVPLDEMYPDLAPEVTMENMELPMFSYFKPNIANNLDLETPLGISIAANAFDTLESLDICFDSFQREFVLGKKRLIVPAHMLKKVTDPSTGRTYQYYDANEEVYEGLNFDSNEKLGIDDNTQTLRVEEHIAAINAFLSILCVQVGADPGFVSFSPEGGLKTATEVISENSRTYRTKVKHQKAVRKNLEDLVGMIVQMGVLYGDISMPGNYEVTVVFDDSIIEDKRSEKLTDMQEVAAGILRPWEYRMKWYGETAEDAKSALSGVEEPPEEE